MVDVVPVTADSWADLETLFTDPRFGRGDSPHPDARPESSCWCMWPRVPRGDFRPWDPANRSSMRELVASGAMPGLVCLVGGEPQGWCALGPCGDFTPYRFPPYVDLVEPTAWAVPCVEVVPEARGSGVADALVEQAKIYAAQRGATVLYGPPQWWKGRGQAEYGGVTRLFVRRGFTQVAAGERVPVFRCRLDGLPV
ncbi:GNAT family N-acetyltransferase [Actinopolymorpha sp. B9G3]|uniref:GNAT family N-acetyltransferase n=1 Tax=Actinopolymorpha sp. B9G3 TaxID=3158970 RepID=UPI0032D9829C